MAEYDMKKLQKSCGNRDCPHGGWIDTANSDHEPYVEIEFRDESHRGKGECVFYHADCAPLSGTTIPDELGMVD